MEAPRRYAYVTPWKIVIPAVAIIALCGFVPFWFGRLILSTRTEYVGITFMIVSVTFIAFCFFALGVAFFVMAALGLIVRLGFRRTLVLDDRCIIVPSGFFRLRHRRIPYVDVTQMWERRSPDGVTLWVVTEEAKSEIQSWLLTKPASYDEIKRFIYARAPEVQRLFAHHEPPAWMTWIVPKPLLKWTEPGDWQRYRTHLFDTSPLGARLGRAVWFFARWFGCFLVLWLGASLLDTPFWPSLQSPVCFGLRTLNFGVPSAYL